MSKSAVQFHRRNLRGWNYAHNHDGKGPRSLLDMSKLRWRALFSHADLRLTVKLPMEMVEKSTNGQWQGCSTDVCPSSSPKRWKCSWICGHRWDCVLIMCWTENQWQNIIPCKADDRDPWEQHRNHFVHIHVSTKLEATSPLCVFIYLWFISCNSNFLSSKQTLFWDVLLPDLPQCSPCFICLNLLTENKDIVHQWSICSRELLQAVVSTRCFLRKHPQHSGYPQWMFKCINCKTYHHVFLKKPFFACFVTILP